MVGSRVSSIGTSWLSVRWCQKYSCDNWLRMRNTTSFNTTANYTLLLINSNLIGEHTHTRRLEDITQRSRQRHNSLVLCPWSWTARVLLRTVSLFPFLALAGPLPGSSGPIPSSSELHSVCLICVSFQLSLYNKSPIFWKWGASTKPSSTLVSRDFMLLDSQTDFVSFLD